MIGPTAGIVISRCTRSDSSGSRASEQKTKLEESVPDLGKDFALGSEHTASEHLRKVLQSEALRGSPMLRRLLEYIGTSSLDGRGSELKEYTIRVEI